jgi:P-type Ca2+ transporter type 2C
MEEWHRLEVSEVLQKLNTSPEKGLSETDIEERLQQYGHNELIEKGIKSPWKILWEQLTGVMVVILLVSAIISFFLQEYTDAIVILIIVVLNALLGFTQEYKAEQAMAALKKMAVPHVRVKRSGHTREISARELVPGDIILVEAGSSIPADCRVIESVNLRIQEAILTGESEPVEKEVQPIDRENTAIGDRLNMLFMGTAATYGRGSGVVVRTGMQTELGRIAEMIQSVGQEQTPLQRRLGQLGKNLAVAALAIVAVVFVIGVLRGEDLRLMFQTAISMAVAAVPEGLPAVVTIALAVGAQRMLKRKALIRKLPAVETLGSVTVICSDKTGTLTENRMTVTVLDVAGNRVDFQQTLRDFSPTININDEVPELLEEGAITMLLTGGALANDAILEASEKPDGSFSAVGDPTEGALVIAAAQVGLWKSDIEKAMPRVAELPFDSDRKRMSTLHTFPNGDLPEALDRMHQLRAAESQDKYIGFTKGAVDSLMEVSTQIWNNGKVEQLNDEWRERIQDANDRLAANGMRVLGVAYRTRDSQKIDEESDSLEKDLTFIGMVGMIDPARSEVREAVRVAQAAGIRPIMITGDHPLTALYIARELGITRQSRVVTGQELARTSPEKLQENVEDISVYARVSPEHKLKIVQALQNLGHIVAMTGDGVNDAPALKKADIGVAMGITGTDVSKEASDMVLLDDNFATIVAAVEEGRRIYDNIRKFVRYTMTSNAGEILVVLIAPFLGMPLPLTPLQILWVNLVTDGLPGLALTIEPAERGTMSRDPYNPKESIFNRPMINAILWIGGLMAVVSILAGYFHYQSGLATWQTMIFTTLTIAQMGNALATRSTNDNLFKIGLFSNKAMLGSVLLTFLLQIAVVYVPFFQNIFGTVALSVRDLGISFALAAVVFVVIEIVKWIRTRLNKQEIS